MAAMAKCRDVHGRGVPGGCRWLVQNARHANRAAFNHGATQALATAERTPRREEEWRLRGEIPGAWHASRGKQRLPATAAAIRLRQRHQRRIVGAPLVYALR